MFPPGGNNPGISRFMTSFSQTRGGQGQPAPISPQGPMAGGAGPAPSGQMQGPAESAGDHFAEAYRHIVAAMAVISQNPKAPENVSAIEAFQMALSQLQPQAAPGPSGPTGFPAVNAGAAQSAPSPRGV